MPQHGGERRRPTTDRGSTGAARRFVVFGAGAVGGVVGARLFQAGERVVLVARGAHFAAMRERGLTIRDADRSATLAIPVVDDLGALPREEGDVVLLAVKSQHTDAALAAIRAWRSAAPAETGPDVTDVPDVPDVPVVCLQNGVDNERRALRLFPRVYSVVVMCPTTHLLPGVVDACSAPVTGILDVGRYAGGDGAPVDDLARELAATFARATFVSEPRADIMRWKRAKLLMNLGNAVVALCTPGEDADALVADARAEGKRAFAAAGLAFASDDEDRARRGDLIQKRPIAGAERAGGSTWQSFARATGDQECDAFHGEIALLGRLFGVAAPVNALLQAVAARAAAEKRAPRSIDARVLRRTLAADIDEARRALAPTGTLRAAINLGNVVLAQGTLADPRGATVDVAREIGRRLGVPVALTAFPAAGKAFAALVAGDVDIAFLANEPARASEIEFTHAYVVIEGCYLVAKASRFQANADVDVAGVRVAVNEASAYDLFLTRSLKNATLVRSKDGVGAFLSTLDGGANGGDGGADLAAGVKQALQNVCAARNDVRILEPRFMEIRQAMACAKGNTAGARYLNEALADLARTGFLRAALDRSGQTDAALAPL